jgi:CRISPR-associated protein Cas2
MPRSYLICYDIRCKKRLTKIHKIVLHYAVPLQFSVFYGLMTQAELTDMTHLFTLTMDEKADDIRIYPIYGSTLKDWPKKGFVGNDKFLLLN